MSSDPVAPRGGNKVRWTITGCLFVLAVLCVAWIASLKLSDQVVGSPLEKVAAIFAPIAALDVLGLIALGVWVLRPPRPGALGFFGRWFGKVVLFLGLSAAVVVFLF